MICNLSLVASDWMGVAEGRDEWRNMGEGGRCPTVNGRACDDEDVDDFLKLVWRINTAVGQRQYYAPLI